MQKKSKFLKGIKSKNLKSTKDIREIPHEDVPCDFQNTDSIEVKRQDLQHFQFIGIYDRKVILTYNNQLQGFGYFDLHAMHERIRYEHYIYKIRKQSQPKGDINSPFDEQCIEKRNQVSNNIYGNCRKILVKVSSSLKNMFVLPPLSQKTIWGIKFQTNSIHQVYATSYRQILGKQLKQQEIQIIFNSIENDQNEIPKLIDEWIGQYSCKSAFKFNDNLNESQAKMLLKNLSYCIFPWHCVHGRTTISFKRFQM